MRCIQCNNLNHKHSDYRSYKDTIKNDIITFNKGKIKVVVIDELLDINFERCGINKLMEDRLEKNSSSRSREVETFIIEAEYSKVETPTHVSIKVMVKEA